MTIGHYVWLQCEFHYVIWLQCGFEKSSGKEQTELHPATPRMTNYVVLRFGSTKHETIVSLV